MNEKEVPSEEKEGKGSGCSKLLQAGFVVLGLFVILQVLRVIGDNFGSFANLCCIGLILITILVVVYVFQVRRKKATEMTPELKSIQAEESWMLLEKGERLLSQGKQEEAVAVYLQAYLEGSPIIKKLAFTALDELGKVETF